MPAFLGELQAWADGGWTAALTWPALLTETVALPPRPSVQEPLGNWGTDRPQAGSPDSLDGHSREEAARSPPPPQEKEEIDTKRLTQRSSGCLCS